MLRANVAVGMEDVIATLSDVPAPLQKSLQRFLMERGLGQDIGSWVKARRAQGKSWETIAAEMTRALDLPGDVTPVRRQLLQKWVKE